MAGRFECGNASSDSINRGEFFFITENLLASQD